MDKQLGLYGDKYKYTMAQAWLGAGKADEQVTYDYFIRDVKQRNYFVVAGVSELLERISQFTFGEKELAYLRKKGYSEELLTYLEGFHFSGDIAAMLDGNLAFPNEPVLRVSGSRLETSLLETLIETTMNAHTMVATKAARIVHAAKGRPVIDFSPRRDHDLGAAMMVAKESYVAGCIGTSLEEAGEAYGIPTFGTMGHEWIMSFADEQEAFRAYARAWPDDSVFLIDTYDTVSGAKNAAVVAKEMAASGHALKGVRLDSGDMLALSKEVRAILDDEGLLDVKILASGDLNEQKITALLAAGAPIDMFGVGTEMGVSKDAPSMPGVYKLAHDELLGPRLKLSDDAAKTTLPGVKQVYRVIRPDRKLFKDVIALADEELPKDRWIPEKVIPMLTPVMRNGERLSYETAEDARVRTMVSLIILPDEYFSLEKKVAAPVEKSAKLVALQERLIAEHTAPEEYRTTNAQCAAPVAAYAR